MVVKAKYSARILKYETDLLAELKDYYGSADLTKSKTNADFILHICTCIENTIFKNKKKYKYDKKMMAIRIIAALCNGLTEDEKRTVDSTIESLHSQGNVAKIKLLKKIKDFILSFLKKIFLK